MSNIQYAFVKTEHLPDRASLQKWIDALGYDLKLDPDLNLKDDEGYSPCVLDGKAEAGFELESGSTEEMADGDEDFLALAEGRDFCVSMTWRSSMKDCAAVMMVSCALAKNCDAVISYGGDAPDSLEKMMEATTDILAEARKET